LLPDRGIGTRNVHRELIDGLIQGLVSQGRRTAALGEAARWGRIDWIEALLASGLGVDDRNEDGNTPLLMGASGGQSHVVAYLIERGADVNAVSGWRAMTPLMACVSAMHSKRVYLKTLELLLAAGAARTLGVRDTEGRTALDWARDGRPQAVVTLLEAHGND
jgi:ankyrin repeat protein